MGEGGEAGNGHGVMAEWVMMDAAEWAVCRSNSMAVAKSRCWASMRKRVISRHCMNDIGQMIRSALADAGARFQHSGNRLILLAFSNRGYDMKISLAYVT
jgi:hypothetical protein